MQEASDTVWPLVSVVIPVRNEAGAVVDAVRSVLSQEYPGEIEVVVADGMSNDGTREALASFGDVKVVDNDAGTAPAGLNRAIEAATGSIIVRCDAHSILPPGYVRRAVEVMQETGAANVGGVQRTVGTTRLERAIAAAMSSPVGVGDARYRLGGEAGPVDTVYLGVFDRATLDRLGGFDEHLTRNQDYELNIRLRKAGGVVYFHPDLEVEYRPRSSLRALWRQYYDYGTWKRHVLQMHPESWRARQLAAPLLVLALAVSGAAAVAGAWEVAVIVPAAWLIALLGAAATALGTVPLRSAVLVPVALATMHLAWGWGFLLAPAQPATKRS